MSLYIIAVGGTGAKFAESVVHLAAIGIFSEVDVIKILFVDPDEANGNLDRAKETSASYEKCRALVTNSAKSKDVPWMIPQIQLFNPKVWSPLSGRDNKNLSSLFNYGNYNQDDPLKGLFDTLFTKDERELSLEMGFRGRPAIGAAVMSQLDLDAGALDSEPWITLFNQIQADVGGAGKDITVCLCGSAFGGTGASGFPTLGKLIANKLDTLGYRTNAVNKSNTTGSSKTSANGDDNKVKLGGILLLPYFSFEVPPEFSISNEIYASPDQFLLNTEAALRYYRVQAQGIFDTIYLLGNQSLAQVGQFSLGRGDQCNESHFLELYAGLAIRHFLAHKPKQTGEAGLISRARPKAVVWSDLPDDDVKQRLVNATRFAFAWLADLNEIFDDYGDNFEKKAPNAPWMLKFFEHKSRRSDLPNFNRESDKIATINEWCRSYLLWLAELHNSTGSDMSLQLFNRSAFIDENGQIHKNYNKFLQLVVGSSNGVDNIATLKQRLDPKIVSLPKDGIVGLARALYKLCDLK
jgi:hypothetical protein